jgi:hypothetical protein
LPMSGTASGCGWWRGRDRAWCDYHRSKHARRPLVHAAQTDKCRLGPGAGGFLALVYRLRGGTSTKAKRLCCAKIALDCAILDALLCSGTGALCNRTCLLG